VKNLALLAHVTTEEESDGLIQAAFNLGVEDLNILSGAELNSPKNYLVFMNGYLECLYRSSM
jgi:DNA-directed RNA polymerase III subunit RPC2